MTKISAYHCGVRFAISSSLFSGARAYEFRNDNCVTVNRRCDVNVAKFIIIGLIKRCQFIGDIKFGGVTFINCEAMYSLVCTLDGFYI